MDFQYYTDLLLKRKWAILLSILIGAAAAFFIAESLPKTYRGEAIVQTGVLNYDGDPSAAGFVQEYQINARFENLIEELRSRKMLTLLGFRLLIHDLTSDDPFRKDVELPAGISEDDKAALLKVLKQKIAMMETDLSPKYARIYSQIAKAYGYDFDSIRKRLEVERVKKTDYLRLSFDDHNPELAAFVPNTLVKDLIAMTGDTKFEDQKKVIANYDMLVKEKRAQLDSINQLMDQYMRSRAVTDLSQESKVLVSNLSEQRNQLAKANQQVRYLESAIDKVEREISSLERRGGASSAASRNNSRIIAQLKAEIDQLRSQYVAGGEKDKDLLAQILKKEKQYSLLIKNSSGDLIRSGKDDQKRELSDLRKRKLDLELQLQDANASVIQYESSIRSLEAQIPAYVTNDSYLTNLRTEKTHLEDQYAELQTNLSNARATNTKQNVRLKVIEYAQVPQEPKDRKLPFLVAFAGLGSGALATMLIFLLAFFDTRLTNANQFRQFVKLPLLGLLPYVKKGFLSGRLFKENDSKLIGFKEALRAIRFNFEESGEDVFLVTSMNQRDGKSFVTSVLAEALSANGKKVLVIDTNFRHNSLSQSAPKGTYRFGIVLQKLIEDFGLENAFEVRENAAGGSDIAVYDQINNPGLGATPMEVLAGKDMNAFLEELLEMYDIILMEGAALSEYADSRELERFADRVVAVFAANSKLHNKDKESIAYLASLKDTYLGSILNGVDPANMD